MKLKIITMSSALSTCFFIGNAYANEEISCEVEFNHNSSVTLINSDSFEQCFAKLDGKDVGFATVIGSASSVGNQRRNQKLAQERAITVERAIKSKFPEAVVKRIAVGANKDLGKKSEISFLIKDNSAQEKIADLSQQIEGLQFTIQQEKLNKERAKEEEQRIASINQGTDELPAKEKEPGFFDGNPNFRIALRSGIDSTIQGPQRNYLSGGGEFAWINRSTFIRPEVGAKLMSSIDGVTIDGQEVNKVINAYGFLGGGVALKGFVTGARLLLGNEWIDIDSKTSKINDFAIGGEARLGYEWERGVSVFASYALTERIQMIGLDVGYSF